MARISLSIIEGMNHGMTIRFWGVAMAARYHGMIMTMAQRLDAANVGPSCSFAISVAKCQVDHSSMHYCVGEINALASKFVVVVVAVLLALKDLSAEELAILPDNPIE